METPESGSSVESPAKQSYSVKWLWPSITTEEEARKAARAGGYAAAFVALCTGVVSLVAITTKQPLAGIDGLALIDTSLFAVAAWKTFKFSFPWAVFGLLLECYEVYWKWNKGRLTGNIVVPALIILALIAGVRGTAFLSKRESPAAAIIVIVCAITFAMAVIDSVRP